MDGESEVDKVGITLSPQYDNNFDSFNQIIFLSKTLCILQNRGI